MQSYEFYLEYDGKRTVAQDYSNPVDTIVEATIEKAGKKFARRKKLKFMDYDVLMDDHGFRLYFENKKSEFIYYVKVTAEE